MIQFPQPIVSDENGIVAVGGELTVENVVWAYSLGIFPWPHGNLPLLWFCPIERGVLNFDSFKIPESVKKELRKKNFRMSYNQAFDAVIDGCAQQKRQGQKGTWITPAMKKTYRKLHELGYAQSVECWNGDDLVGGLYGVYIQNVFSGESMFFKESGASKACLIALVNKLKSLGHEWFDIQMVTPVLALFGGESMDRETFLEVLKATQNLQRPGV